MNGRIDGWMDGWMDEVSCLGLSWAAGQSCGSRWWSPWVEAQVTWLQGAPPCPALFPLLLLGCSANFLVFISSISSFTGLISNIKKAVTSVVNLVEMYLVQDVVSTPLLAAQSQARWGADVTFPGWAVLFGHLPFWGAHFLRAVSCCSPPSFSLVWGEGEEGSDISRNHWIPTWIIYHTHALPVGLLAIFSFIEHNFI